MTEPQVFSKSGNLNMSKPARLQVSLFNPNCSGARLSAICDWLVTQGVHVLEFQVADSLQRHNLWWRERITDTEAYSASVAAGDKWIADNKSTIFESFSRFRCVSVTRWDYWLSLKEYLEARSMIDRMFSKDQFFRKVVEQEVEEYFASSARSPKAERKKSSVEFLLEETAVSEASQAKSPANEIYPGKEFVVESYIKNSSPSEYQVSLRHADQIYLEFN